MLDENKLLKEALISADAMEELLTKYKYLVKQIARSYFLIGGEPEDLVQEGMIGLYGAVISYNGKCPFSNFASICIKRRIMSAIKIANRQKNKLLNESVHLSIEGGIKKSGGDNEIFIIPSTLPSLDEQLGSKQEYEIIQKIIDEKLSKLEKQVLKYYLKGYSSNEIAKNLNTNTKAIENALLRARTKILNNYEKE